MSAPDTTRPEIAADFGSVGSRAGSASLAFWLLVLALAAVAAWLRWPGLDSPFGEDEATVLVGHARPFEFASWRALDPADLTHTAAQRLTATGSSRLVRAPYLAWGLLGIVAGALLGRTLAGPAAGALLALALACWPYKAWLDTQAREYTALLSLMLLALWLWERYRRRPGVARALLAGFVTLLASRAHMLGIVLALAPPLYLAWSMAEQSWRRRRHARQAEPYGEPTPGDSAEHDDEPHPSAPEIAPTGRFMLGLAGQCAAIVALSLLSFYLCLGPGYLGKLLPGGRATAEVEIQGYVSPGERETAPVRTTRTVSVHGETATVPRVRGALNLLAEGLREALAGRSVRPLLGLSGLEQGPSVFTRLTVDPRGESGLPRGGAVDALLLAALLAGSLGLLFRSPPLTLALWLIVVIDSQFTILNEALRAPDARYWTPAATALLVTMVCGVAALFGLPARFMRRLGGGAEDAPGPSRTTRIAGNLALGLVVVASLALLAVTADPVRASVRQHDKDWRAFYDRMREEFPHGALFHGPRAVNFTLEQWLAEARWAKSVGDLSPIERYWRAPRRNTLLEGDAWRGDPLARTLERLNGYQGFVLTANGAAAGATPELPAAFAAGRFDTALHDVGGVAALSGGVGGQAFVTRGRLALPLAPWLREADGATWRLRAAFEVPGEYELTIDRRPGWELSELTVGGARLTPVERAFEQAGEPALDGRWSEGPTTATAPVLDDTETVWSARFAAPDGFFDGEPLETTIAFAATEEGPVPIVRWRLVDQPWAPLGDTLELGNLQIEHRDGAFEFTAPLRIVDPAAPLTRVVVRLRGPDGGDIGAWAVPVEMRRRRLAAGDAIWTGRLRAPDADVRRILGVPWALEIVPFASDDPLEAVRLGVFVFEELEGRTIVRPAG